MLSEASQVQKHKGCMFSLICGKYSQEINYTQKPAWLFTNSDVKYVCNSETTLWESGREAKENRMIEHQ
jgi:hypothetical protein